MQLNSQKNFKFKLTGLKWWGAQGRGGEGFVESWALCTRCAIKISFYAGSVSCLQPFGQLAKMYRISIWGTKPNPKPTPNLNVKFSCTQKNSPYIYIYIYRCLCLERAVACLIRCLPLTKPNTNFSPSLFADISRLSRSPSPLQSNGKCWHFKCNSLKSNNEASIRGAQLLSEYLRFVHLDVCTYIFGMEKHLPQLSSTGISYNRQTINRWRVVRATLAIRNTKTSHSLATRCS